MSHKHVRINNVEASLVYAPPDGDYSEAIRAVLAVLLQTPNPVEPPQGEPSPRSSPRGKAMT